MEDLDVRFLMTYPGVVVDNADPLGLSRVRVKVAGIFEPYADWATPSGTSGGGSKQRGSYGPPDIGADVTLGFYMADEHRPWFLAGGWGEGEGSSYTAGMSAADAALVKVIESAHFLIVIDERAGHEALILTEKASGNLVKVAGANVFVGSDTGAFKLINENCPDPFTGATHGVLAGSTGQTSITKGK